MADSSEKVSFLVDMQCSSLRAEAFLVFDKGSQPTLGQQITDMQPQSADSRPTNGQQSADCWQKIFVRGGKRQSADSWPTVGRLSSDLANCWPTVGRLLANSRPTVFWGSCSSLFPKCQFQFNSRIVKAHFSGIMTLNN